MNGELICIKWFCAYNSPVQQLRRCTCRLVNKAEILLFRRRSWRLDSVSPSLPNSWLMDSSFFYYATCVLPWLLHAHFVWIEAIGCNPDRTGYPEGMCHTWHFSFPELGTNLWVALRIFLSWLEKVVHKFMGLPSLHLTRTLESGPRYKDGISVPTGSDVRTLLCIL